MTSASLPNIGFVGLGWPGERHAEAIIASALGTVHSACDLNQERLEKFATAFRPTRLFTDFAEMLSRSGCGGDQPSKRTPLSALVAGLTGRQTCPLLQNTYHEHGAA